MPQGADKLDRWSQQLLDLTLRNRLLNHRDTQKTLPLATTGLAGLLGALYAGERLRLYPDEAAEMVMEGAPGVIVALDEPSLRKRVVLTAREAATLEGESGVNALNLAVGFLRWREREDAPWREAPVLLCPARLHRERGGRYRLSLSDEEPSFNATLLQKLRQDFDLDLGRIAALLPDDDEGEDPDINLILNSLQAAVTARGWGVERRARLAVYAFQKHLMFWELTHGRDLLMDHPLVRRLVEGEDEHTPPPFPRPASLDRRPPASLTCPLDADASQLAALYAAAAGETFVLEGPPGTGKSQTITNLIAHTLSRGKTVLFVSEKVAPLEVVRARLEAIGLGPACLPLHASDAQKHAVMASIKRALEAPRSARPAGLVENAEALAAARERLNAVADALAAPSPMGPSLHEVIGRALELGEGPRVALEIDPEALTAEALRRREEAVEELAAARRQIGSPEDHPLREIGASTLTAEAEARLEGALDALEAAARAYEAALVEVEALLKLPARRDQANLGRLHKLLLGLQEKIGAPGGLVTHPNWTILESQARRWIERGRRRDALRLKIGRQLSTDIVRLDVRSIIRRYERWSSAFSLLSWLMLFRISRLLRPLWRREPPPRRQIADALRPALELQDLEVEVYGLSDEARPILGDWWRGGEVDWGLLEQGLGWAGTLRPLLHALVGEDRAALGVSARAIGALLALGPEARTPEHPKGAKIQAAVQARSRFEGARAALHALLQPDARFWDKATPIQTASELAARWRGALNRLREWQVWRRACVRGAAVSLDPLIAALTHDTIHVDEAEGAFWRGLYEGWISAKLDDPTLRDFQGEAHEREIGRFRRLDLERQRIAALAMLADVSARRPVGREVSARSQLGRIKAEVAKRRRFMPLRRLFKETKEALRHLKPCMLMSPLSISRFLDLDDAPFDLVIFDEASQISPWDALGALARGRSAVIVGDHRQLPPTRFFDKAHVDDEGGALDGESVLEACLEVGVSRFELQWHYRSRHEQLIAFSNRHYYDERLMICPTADPHVGGLSLRRVAGTYERSGRRVNVVEAQAVVDEVIRHVHEQPELTLGVVTFNLAQQGLISDLLDEARLRHPALDAALDATPPLFVKNLETVQGDERDVILFSVTYGPNSRGQVHLNFGPLSQRGGERRLNVAITRARRALVVFSSMDPEAIDPKRVKSLGVKHLRAFLEGARAGRLPDQEGGEASLTALGAAARACLEAEGAEVHAGVGVGAWRVDLAVVDEAGRFILGVELDGPGYRAETATDRDRLRPSVLRRRGWRAHRVWAPDWYRDPEGTMDKLRAALAAARDGAEIAPIEEAAPARPTLSLEKGPRAGLVGAEPERVAQIEGGRGAAFYYKQTTPQLARALAAIVAAEGPVAEDRAARTLARAYGLKTLTQRLKDRMSVLHLRLPRACRPREGFLWPEGRDPEAWRGFRPARHAKSRRDVEHIPVEEWANAAESVIRHQFGIPRDDLVRELAQVFGYSRPGEKLAQAAGAGIERLLSEGRAIVVGDQIKLRRRL